MSDQTKAKADTAPKTYEVVTEFWDGPVLRKERETVSKTLEEAKYLTPSPLKLKKPEAARKQPENDKPKASDKASGKES